MSIIILGAQGMLGRALSKELESQGYVIIPLGSSHCDITDKESVSHTIASCKMASIVINCAAYTNVDAAELEKEKVNQINGEGVKNVAEACKKNHKCFMHFSTEYVFNGEKKDPYVETDQCDPINAYGYSKWLGEKAIQEICSNYYIFRIQWLYGKGGRHFIDTMKDLLKEKERVSVVCDQYGTPTCVTSLSTYIAAVIKKEPEYGVYHCRDREYSSWFDVAKYIADTIEYRGEIVPVLSTEFPRPAKRPCNGRLETQKFESLQIINRQPWKKSLLNYLQTG